MATHSESFDALVDHLVATARAHHAATGGVNPQWANWYAERLKDRVNDLVGSGMSVDQLENWLIEADRRYKSERQDTSWPEAYAAWLLDGSP